LLDKLLQAVHLTFAFSPISTRRWSSSEFEGLARWAAIGSKTFTAGYGMCFV
jgi:hypothetical protein